MENFFEDLKTSVMELLPQSEYSLSTGGNSEVLGLRLHKRRQKIIIHAVKGVDEIIINAQSGPRNYKGICVDNQSCSTELASVKQFLLKEFHEN